MNVASSSPRQALERLKRLFLPTCATILATTAAGKILALISDTQYMRGVDEIVPLERRVLLGLVAICELAIVGISLLKRNSRSTYFAIAWFSSILLSYRFVRFCYGIAFACPCLGLFASYLPFTAQTAGMVMTLCAIYMLAGSIIALLRWS